MSTRNPFAKDLPEARSSALTEALARIESLWNVIRANGDTNARLMAERDEALQRLADSEARVERLWAQLNEATNVPDHNDPEFGSRVTLVPCDCPRCTHYREQVKP